MKKLLGDTIIFNDNLISFKSLPFYWKPLDTPYNNKLPISLPFKVEIDKNTGVLFQKDTTEIELSLKNAYESGTEIIGLMDASDIGRQYANDFMKYIDHSIGLNNIKGKNILEIGSGNGYLLHCFQEMGSNVKGYEPGFSAIGKFDVPVYDDFFPTNAIKNEKFDYIIFFAVLEHIKDTGHFLCQVKEHLDKDGKVIIAVPNVEHHLKQGDISIFIHEHYSYFTPASLVTFLQKKGYYVESVQPSDFGGSIYCTYTVTEESAFISENRDEIGSLFPKKLEQNTKAFYTFLKSMSGKTLGIYVPIRAMNFLYLFKEELNNLNITLRFFDDSEVLKDKYLPGFNVPIENKDNLKTSPPDCVCIYSFSFGDKIKETLQSLYPDLNVILIDEILSK
jgi:SAM-dependent methyltransferase